MLPFRMAKISWQSQTSLSARSDPDFSDSHPQIRMERLLLSRYQKRTSNSRSSLFLIELIIAILFFSLVSAVCLRAFARSHILTENARDLNAALMHVESTAELLRAGESVEAQTFYSSSWDTCEEKKAAYMITVKEKDASDEDSGTDSLTTYRITARQLNNGRKIYSLNVTCHTPYSIKEAAGHE